MDGQKLVTELMDLKILGIRHIYLGIDVPT